MKHHLKKSFLFHFRGTCKFLVDPLFLAALLEYVKAKYYYSLKSLIHILVLLSSKSIHSFGEFVQFIIILSHFNTTACDCLTYTLEPRGTENAGRFLSCTMIITKLELLRSYLLKKGQREGSSLFAFMYEQKYCLSWSLT